MNQGGAWSSLFLLGAYHGINPAMGWLFAVAVGMQEKSRRSVARAILPLGLGHILAIAVVVVMAAAAVNLFPLSLVQLTVGLGTLAVGVFLALRRRHPRWGGMKMGFRDLTIWSFLMASAHGAGLMVLPIILQPEFSLAGGVVIGVAAIAAHSAGYLLVTALAAVLVYEKLGLALLRKAWVNLDLIWAFALILAGVVLVFTSRHHILH